MKNLFGSTIIIDKQCSITKFIRETPVILDKSDSVATAVRLMKERNLGAILVSCDKDVTGIFTEQDLLKRVVACEINPANISLVDVCSSTLVSIPSSATCGEAIMKMRTHRCRRLLVYNNTSFIGLVELPDIANSIAMHERRKDWLPNIIVGITLALVITVIVLLILTLPDMMHIVRGDF